MVNHAQRQSKTPSESDSTGFSITLIKHKMFGANEAVTCPWSNTQIYSANGAFYVQAKDDKKAYIGSSYIEGRNTHIFEQLIRMAYKKPGMRKLSDILN